MGRGRQCTHRSDVTCPRHSPRHQSKAGAEEGLVGSTYILHGEFREYQGRTPQVGDGLKTYTGFWEVTSERERLVIYCQTTSVSAAHATHCATYCNPCRPLIRAFSGWIRTPPLTLLRLCGTPTDLYGVTAPHVQEGTPKRVKRAVCQDSDT